MESKIDTEGLEKFVQAIVEVKVSSSRLNSALQKALKTLREFQERTDAREQERRVPGGPRSGYRRGLVEDLGEEDESLSEFKERTDGADEVASQEDLP